MEYMCPRVYIMIPWAHMICYKPHINDTFDSIVRMTALGHVKGYVMTYGLHPVGAFDVKSSH